MIYIQKSEKLKLLMRNTLTLEAIPIYEYFTEFQFRSTLVTLTVKRMKWRFLKILSI